MTEPRRFLIPLITIGSVFWPLATMLCLNACGKVSEREPEGSATFRKFWAGEVAYLEKIKRTPDGARALADGAMLKDFADARNILVTMSDGQISRINRLGYTAWTAASREKENREVFQYQGTDWTLYADPQAGFQTGAVADQWLSQMERRLCSDYTFRSVRGRVRRSNRFSQDGPPWRVGMVPQGTRHYRGVLMTSDGRQYPIVWTQGWGGLATMRGDWAAYDLLDEDVHVFDLRKLPSARNWTVLRYSGEPDEGESRELTAARCAAILRPTP